MHSLQDEKYMARALELAARGAKTVRPNPLVGAVLVRDGMILGEGWHEYAGGPHAEVNAVADAKRRGFEDLSLSRLYVTLEPCCHRGRTPPCTDLVLQEKISAVVAGVLDPDPRVSGRGLEILARAGVDATAGVLESECSAINSIFFSWKKNNRPWTLLKTAVSLDGKTATAERESKWITADETRADARRRRGEFAAILCGVGTVLADDPLLTPEISLSPGDSRPELPYSRIIVDSGYRTPPSSRVYQEAERYPVLIAGIGDAPRGLKDAGASFIPCEEKNGKVSLPDLFRKLSAMNIDRLLIEGGPTLAAAACGERLVDRVRIYAAPILLGGQSANGMFPVPLAGSIKDALRLRNMSVERLGPDLLIEGDLSYPDAKEAPCSRD